MYDLRGLVIVQYVVSGLPPSTHKPVTCVEQTIISNLRDLISAIDLTQV